MIQPNKSMITDKKKTNVPTQCHMHKKNKQKQPKPKPKNSNVMDVLGG